MQLPRLDNAVVPGYTDGFPVECLPLGHLLMGHLFLHLNPTTPQYAMPLIVHWKKEKESTVTCVCVVVSENLGNYLMN